MAIAFMADDGQTITAAQDGAMYNVFAGNKDFVIGGIGAELAITYSASSLTVTLGTGEGIICGRHFNVTGTDTKVTVPASGSGYLVVRYDLAQSGSNVVRFLRVASLKSENINGSGTAHDLVLGQYTSSASGISSFTDSREIYTAVPIAHAETATTASTANSATVASKLGTSNVGNNTKPIYLSAGTPMAASQNVGSATKPIYMLQGTLTAMSANVGAANQLMYMNSGALTGGITIRSGTSAPNDSDGNDGDIYIQYSN